MAWDDKILADLNALIQNPPSAPEAAKPKQEPRNLSAVEAQILASIQTASTPVPAAEPVIEPSPAPVVAEEPAKPTEIVLDPIPITDDEEVSPPVPHTGSISEVPPEPVAEPCAVTRDDIIHMAFSHAPTELSGEDAKEIFRKTAGDLVPGYLGGMRIEDAVLRCDPAVMESRMAQADTDTLLVFLKFLCIEITTARNEALVSNLETFVTDLLLRRLNGN